MSPIYKLTFKIKSRADLELAPLDIWTTRSLFFNSLSDAAKAQGRLKSMGAVVTGYAVEHVCTPDEAVEYVSELIKEEGK